MDTTELTVNALRAAAAAAAVVGLTAAGAVAAVIDPGLGPGTRPHPTITPGLTAALSIWQSNVRVLAAPFLLAALRFADSRAGRTAGDVILAALTASSTLTVGVAIGRWQWTLAPYLPHLPLEWAALSVSVAAWLLVRQHAITSSALIALAVVIVVLLAGAAILETWATPHRAVGDGHPVVAVNAGGSSPRQRSREPDGVSLRLPARSAGGSLTHHQTPTPIGGITP